MCNIVYSPYAFIGVDGQTLCLEDYGRWVKLMMPSILEIQTRT